MPNINTCARVSNARGSVSHFYKRGFQFSTFLHIFGRPTSLVKNSEDVLRAKLAEKLFFFFQKKWNQMFEILVISQFLSDFVRVKRNISPRLSTSTYSRENVDLTTPLKRYNIGNFKFQKGCREIK